MSRDAQVLAVTQALHALYYQTDPALRAQAQQWLIAFQQSSEAWEIAFILLSQNVCNIRDIIHKRVVISNVAVILMVVYRNRT